MQILAEQAWESIPPGWLSRTRKYAAFSVLFLVAVASTPQLRAQSDASVALVKAGRLRDSRSGYVLAPAAVLIEGDKIKQDGSSSQISPPAGATIIDLGTGTFLPGLLDGHAHLFLAVIVPPEAEVRRHSNGG